MSVIYAFGMHLFVMVTLLKKPAVSRQANSVDFCFTSIILLLDNQYGYLTLSQSSVAAIDKYCKVYNE